MPHANAPPPLASPPADALALAVRDGWPEELLVFHRQYPREAWPGLVLPWMASHWLDIHEWFRQATASVDRGVHAWRAGAVSLEDFQAGLGMRLRQLLATLHHHHHLETSVAFPAVSAAAPEVKRAFEVLDRDHGEIDPMLDRLGEASSALARRDASAPADAKRSADDVAAMLEAFTGTIRMHLRDEEDIVIPVLIARSDRVRGL